MSDPQLSRPITPASSPPGLYSRLLMSLDGASFFRPSAASRTCTGRPYSRSSKHVWHVPLIFAQVVQISVFLKRPPSPGFHLKTVNGRLQILHSCPNSWRVWH